MRNPRRARATGRGWASLAALAILAGILASTTPSGASHLGASSFNATDGNQVDADGTGTTETDWDSYLPDTATDNLFRNGDSASGTGDNSLAGGTKDDTECASSTTGSIPPNKDDLLRFYLYHETIGADTFLYLGYVRALPGTTTASAHGVFELNKLDTKCPSTTKGGTTTQSDFYIRTPGDVRLAFDDEGGDQPIISAQFWQEPCPSGGAGCWSAKDTLDAHEAAGSFNTGVISDRLDTGVVAGPHANLNPEQFAEMKVNMSQAGLLTAGACDGFGAAGLFTGSSGNSDKEQSKDYIAPIPVNITNCGSATITKTFSGGTPATPAVFALHKDEAPTFDLPYDITDPGDSLGTEDAPFFTYAAVSTLSSGITASATSMTVADGSKYPASGSFYVLVDSEIIKVSSRTGNVLSIGSRGVGAPAAATHDASDEVKRLAACDIGTTGGTCTMGNLPYGSYWAEEIEVPLGYTGGDPQAFTLSASNRSASLTFSNQANPVDITVQKQDDASNAIAICNSTATPPVGQPCADFQLYKAGAATTLSSAVTTTTGTTVSVADGTAFAVGDKLIINKEIMNVTAKATNSLTVQRAQLNTTAATHDNGAAVTELTLDKECDPTATAGECEFASVQPSSSPYWIVESVVPTGYGQDPDLPYTLTVDLGDQDSDHVYTFQNPRLFKVITFVCRLSDSTLHESGIVYDSTTVGSDKTPTGFVDAATEATLCGLTGGYVHNNVGTGDHTTKVNIP